MVHVAISTDLLSQLYDSGLEEDSNRVVSAYFYTPTLLYQPQPQPPPQPQQAAAKSGLETGLIIILFCQIRQIRITVHESSQFAQIREAFDFVCNTTVLYSQQQTVFNERISPSSSGRDNNSKAGPNLAGPALIEEPVHPFNAQIEAS